MPPRQNRPVEDLSQVIQLTPAEAPAWFARADLHSQIGDYGEAIADYNEAIRLNPNDRWFCARAGTYAMLGKYDQAAADAHRAIEIKPADRIAWRMLLDIEFVRSGSAETRQTLLAEAEAALGGTGLLFQHAAWNLLLNRRGEYEKICRQAASRFRDSSVPGELRSLARAAAATNEPVLATEQLVERRARRLMRTQPRGINTSWAYAFCATGRTKQPSNGSISHSVKIGTVSRSAGLAWRLRNGPLAGPVKLKTG